MSRVAAFHHSTFDPKKNDPVTVNYCRTRIFAAKQSAEEFIA